jgi:hypothetical protein
MRFIPRKQGKSSDYKQIKPNTILNGERLNAVPLAQEQDNDACYHYFYETLY